MTLEKRVDNMADHWCVDRNGPVGDPLSPDKMRPMVAEGQIVSTDLVWKDGMEDWVSTSQVPGLISPAGAGGRA